MNSTLIKNADPKTGVVYTREFIATEMIQEAIRSRLSIENPHASEQSLDDYFAGKPEKSEGQRINRRLREYVYLDPSMGEGVFINGLIEQLKKLHTLYGETLPDDWIASHILGVEINKDAAASLLINDGGPAILVKDYLLEPINADIIIGNPPYVRQELLDPHYKTQIHRRLQEFYPDLHLSKRCDLYIYFILKALHDLNANGISTLIVPNTWLDSDYGIALRSILAEQFEIVSITDSDSKHFVMDINTIILTVRKRLPQNNLKIQNDSTIKSIPYSQLPKPECSWSGHLFRCPNWLMDILANNQGLTALENLFVISTGIITGNNKEFYTNSPVNGSTEPGIKSPRDSNTILFNKKDVVFWVRNTNVPYKIKRAPILWPDLRGYRHIAVWNKDNLAFEHTFYGLTPKDMGIKPAVALLNSSWIWLMIELFGRRSLGGGAIRLVKSGLRNLPVPRMGEIEVPESFFTRPIGHLATESVKSDRQEIDYQILTTLGIEHTYGKMIDLLQSLMKNRGAKVKSII